MLLLLLLVPLVLLLVSGHRAPSPPPGRVEASFWVHASLPDSWARGYWDTLPRAPPAHPATALQVLGCALVVGPALTALPLEVYLRHVHTHRYITDSLLVMFWVPNAPHVVQQLPGVLLAAAAPGGGGGGVGSGGGDGAGGSGSAAWESEVGAGLNDALWTLPWQTAGWLALAALHACRALGVWSAGFAALWFGAAGLLVTLGCAEGALAGGASCAQGFGPEQRLFADFFAGVFAFFVWEWWARCSRSGGSSGSGAGERMPFRAVLLAAGFALPLLLVVDQGAAATGGGGVLGVLASISDERAVAFYRPALVCLVLWAAGAVGSHGWARRASSCCGRFVMGIYLYAGPVQKALIAKGGEVCGTDLFARSPSANFGAAVVLAGGLALVSHAAVERHFWLQAAPATAAAPAATQGQKEKQS